MAMMVESLSRFEKTESAQRDTDIKEWNPIEDSDDGSRLPSRTNSASRIMMSKCGSSRSHSHVYPHEPTPLHFTQLFYPKESVMPPPATHLKSRRRRGRCGRLTSCCCCSLIATLCSILITLGILLGFATLITWLVLRPIHAPRYSLEEVQIRALSVTPQTNELNGDLGYTLTATNSNKHLGFKYGPINMETSYRGQVFAQSVTPAFYQGHGNVTTVNTGFVVENFVFSGGLGSELGADVERGSVNLLARGSVKVRVKVGVVTTFAIRVHLSCDLWVKPPVGASPGSVITKTCTVRR